MSSEPIWPHLLGRERLAKQYAAEYGVRRVSGARSIEQLRVGSVEINVRASAHMCTQYPQ